MNLAPNPTFRSDSAASLLRAEILNGTSAPGALLAESAVAKRQWKDVADSVLKTTGNEGRAIREANAVVARRKSKK